MVQNTRIGIKFSPRLFDILGLDTNPLINGEDDEIRTPIYPNVNIGHCSLIAGCNVVPYSNIGNYSGKVLRVLSAPPTEGLPSVNVQPIYVPVAVNMLDRITVTLHNMAGHQLTFENDEMVVLLHLRNVIKAL